MKAVGYRYAYSKSIGRRSDSTYYHAQSLVSVAD